MHVTMFLFFFGILFVIHLLSSFWHLLQIEPLEYFLGGQFSFLYNWFEDCIVGNEQLSVCLTLWWKGEEWMGGEEGMRCSFRLAEWICTQGKKRRIHAFLLRSHFFWMCPNRKHLAERSWACFVLTFIYFFPLLLPTTQRNLGFYHFLSMLTQQLEQQIAFHPFFSPLFLCFPSAHWTWCKCSLLGCVAVFVWPIQRCSGWFSIRKLIQFLLFSSIFLPFF